MSVFYIFRHAQTNWNLEKRLQGHTDIPLNDLGRKQATALKQKFSNIKLDCAYSSDLVRASETAQIALIDHNVEIHQTSRLREVDMGEATGLTHDQLNQRYENLWDAFLSPKKEDLEMRFPGGESKKEHLDKTIAFLKEISSNHNSIGISTHGGVILKLLQYCFNYDESFNIRVTNCCLHEFELLNGDIKYIKEIN